MPDRVRTQVEHLEASIPVCSQLLRAVYCTRFPCLAGVKTPRSRDDLEGGGVCCFCCRDPLR